VGIRLLTVLLQQVVGEGRLTEPFRAVLAALVVAQVMTKALVLGQQGKDIVVALPLKTMVSPLVVAAVLLRLVKASPLTQVLTAVTAVLAFLQAIPEVALIIAAVAAAVAGITMTPED